MTALDDVGGDQDPGTSRGDGVAATAVKTILGFLAFMLVSMLVYAVALTILDYPPIANVFRIPQWFHAIWAPAAASGLGVFAGATVIKAMFRRTPRRPIYVAVACIYVVGTLAWIAMLFVGPEAERDFAPLISSIVPLGAGWSVLWRGNGWDQLPGRSV